MKNKIGTPLKIKLVSIFPFFTLSIFLIVAFGIMIMMTTIIGKKISKSNEKIALIYPAFIHNPSDVDQLIKKVDPKYMSVFKKDNQLSYILPVSIESLRDDDYISKPERLGSYEIMNLLYTDFVKNNYKNAIKTISINDIKMDPENLFKVLSLSERNKEYHFYEYLESQKVNLNAEKTKIIIEKE